MEKKRTGFALMSPERVRELARKGYQRTKELGKLNTAPDPEKCKEYGRKGGLATAARRGVHGI